MADLVLQSASDAIEEFPLNGTVDERLRAAVKYAVLAPSSHNTQPWVFRSGPAGLELYADRSRGLPVGDPHDRELVISCGAALFNLRLALRHFGNQEVTTVLPDPGNPDLLARVTIAGRLEPTEEDHLLFRSIAARHTHRLPFEPRSLPAPLAAALEAAAAREGAWLVLLDAERGREALADLIAEGDRRQMADKSFRRELAAWIHPNRTRSRDGIPGYALGFRDLMAAAGPLVIRTFDRGAGQAAKDRELALGSPALGIVGTPANAAGDWIVAGQALERVLLRAQVDGVSASFLNQAVEIPELRLETEVLAGRVGYPQLVLRLGFGQTTRATPRRAVRDVLID